MTYLPRQITGDHKWIERDGIKLYAIQAQGRQLDVGSFLARLDEVKEQLAMNWPALAAFAILHHGNPRDYLVMCWWGNDNELFTHVSVRVGDSWVHNPKKYSFCLYDMEVFQVERQAYIEHMYRERPNLEAYRRARPRVSALDSHAESEMSSGQ